MTDDKEEYDWEVITPTVWIGIGNEKYKYKNRVLYRSTVLKCAECHASEIAFLGYIVASEKTNQDYYLFDRAYCSCLKCHTTYLGTVCALIEKGENQEENNKKIDEELKKALLYQQQSGWRGN